jgi:inorganic triphosphatase YgiF
MDAFELKLHVPEDSRRGVEAAMRRGEVARARLRARFVDAMATQLVYSTDVVRLSRVVATHGSSVGIAFDVGRILAGGRTQPVRELAFDLKQGSRSAAIALARHWCEEHGLWLDPMPRQEAGLRLAADEPVAPPVTALPQAAGRPGTVNQLLAQATAAALRQALANAREILAGGGGDEHVHQLRVGLRRLRTVLRELGEFEALATLDSAVVPAIAALFRDLGRHRDLATLVPAVQVQIASAGGPVAPWVATPPELTPLLRASAVQGAFLALVGWLDTLAEAGSDDMSRADARVRIARRLGRLQRKSMQEGRHFEALDEDARHRVRKRVKRLRYLSELVRPWFAAGKVDRFVDELKQLQDALGQYQDAATGRQLWLEQAQADAGAWFGVGWLAAREEALAVLCGKACRRVAKRAKPFWD